MCWAFPRRQACLRGHSRETGTGRPCFIDVKPEAGDAGPHSAEELGADGDTGSKPTSAGLITGATEAGRLLSRVSTQHPTFSDHVEKI